MLQLNPKETFVIARGISDPSDSSTYYVQAVIRNAKTDALLDTVNLTDRTGGRFSKVWEVPADTSGLGFYITITTRVYTDSGYSVLSDYMQETATYLVQERVNAFLGSGGGGGPDIDYKRIASIFKDALAKAVSSMPKPDPVDLEPVLSLLKGLKQAISDIEMPEPNEVDLSDLTDGVKRILEAVKAIKIPEPKEDHSDIIDFIQEENSSTEKEITDRLDEIESGIAEMAQTFAGYIQETLGRFDSTSKIHKALSESGMMGTFPQVKNTDAEDPEETMAPDEEADPIKRSISKRPWLALPFKEQK